jgi:hypothetical protein
LGPAGTFHGRLQTLFESLASRTAPRRREPRFDLTRFHVPFWLKYERMLRHARDRDVIVSVIFFNAHLLRGSLNATGPSDFTTRAFGGSGSPLDSAADHRDAALGRTDQEI